MCGWQNPVSVVSIDILRCVDGSRTRSCSVVDAPCIEAPPCTLILVLGAGEEVRDEVREPERTLGRSEIRCPAAEGGGLEDAVGLLLGSCSASGWSDNASVFASTGSTCDFPFPAM